MKISVSVIIPAAGLSKRMKGFPKRKPFIYLGKKPIIEHTLDIFKKISAVKEIILVVNKKDLDSAKKYLEQGIVKVIQGGAQRKDSVYNGIKYLKKDSDIILIHDGVRPFVTKDIILNSIKAAAEFGAAVVAVPVIPTIKRVDKYGFVASTLNREFLWDIQTPQAFRREIIVKAYENCKGDNITDDAMLVEKTGHKVKIVIGSYDNIKITTPKDLKMAWFMGSGLKPDPINRAFGFGYDIHRLIKGRKLILGGVMVPHDRGLLGHSDADVLLHAVIDALLGAAGLGDIGRHFPDTDKKYKGISSKILLKNAAGLLYKNGFVIGNIDAVLVLEKPKLPGLKEKMAKNIAEILDIAKDKVNIKAKTNEGLDSIGRGKAIAAYAVAALCERMVGK